MSSAERRGIEIGKQEGIKLGKQETLVQLISENLQKGLDLDTIASFLGIDRDTAAELAGKVNSKK